MGLGVSEQTLSLPVSPLFSSPFPFLLSLSSLLLSFSQLSSNGENSPENSSLQTPLRPTKTIPHIPVYLYLSLSLSLSLSLPSAV